MSYLPVKMPGESVVVSHDWSDDLDAGETITADSATLEVSVHGGEPDATPGAILSGAAQIDGTFTKHRVILGNPGTDYALLWTIDTSAGNTYQAIDILPVRDRR